MNSLFSLFGQPESELDSESNCVAEQHNQEKTCLLCELRLL